MRCKLLRRATALALILATAAPATFAADPVEDFYKKNNQVTLLIGFGPGTGYDVWGRVVTHYLSKYMPGHPTFVLKNMPGAGSLTMANHLYTVAAKDGTVIGSFSRNLPSQVMIGLENANLDPRKFGYIGSPELPFRVCAVMAATGINSVEDLQKKELFVGGTGPGTVPTFLPPILNKMAGTKFKVIDGYQSAGEIYLGMQRGEVGGICQSYTPIVTSNPELYKEGKLKVLFNLEQKRNPVLKGAPSIFEYLKSDEDKKTLAFINSSTELGRPYVTPPGIPAERLAALRKAFDDAVKDPAFLADAEKAQLDIGITSGAELQQMVDDLYKIPKALVEQANAMMKQGKK